MRRLALDMVQDDPAMHLTMHRSSGRTLRRDSPKEAAHSACLAGPRDEWFGHLVDLGNRVPLAIQRLPSETAPFASQIFILSSLLQYPQMCLTR
jgi:hypothetical protein